jgi:hypothetical protein
MNFDITAFIDNLIMYDYILFGSCFTLFILFIILGIVLRKKMILAVFMILLAFLFITLIPLIGYIQMHKFLFKNTIEVVSQKRLSFTKAIVIKGTLQNSSKFDFTDCKVSAQAFKVTGNQYKDMILKFKPIKKGSVTIEDIKKSETKEFKIFLEPFTYSKDFNISIDGDCR